MRHFTEVNLSNDRMQHVSSFYLFRRNQSRKETGKPDKQKKYENK